MNRTAISTAVSALLLVSGTVPALAASNKVQPTTTLVVVSAKQEPEVRLNGNTLNAINNPNLPKASIPEQKVKPESVEGITESINNQPKPQPNNTANRPTQKPKLPSLATATVERPQLETNRQLEQFRQIQEAIAAMAVLRQIDPDIHNAARLPGQAPEDPAAGTDFEGQGGIGREETDVNQLVRELMGLRGDGFNSDGYIGPSDREIGRLDQYGTGTAPGSELVDDGGLASSETHKGNSVVTTTTEDAEDGSGDTITTTSTVNEDGSSSTNMTIKNAQGEIVFSSTTAYDAGGDISYDGWWSAGPSAKAQTSVQGRLEGVIRKGSGKDSQPNETAPSKYSDCNQVSGFGCVTKETDHMDKIAQPVHGDKVAARSSTPNPGIEAVINREGDTSGGGGGGGGGKPGDSATDPEEIIPDAGGIGPAPGEVSAAAATATSDEATDAAMGLVTME